MEPNRLLALVMIREMIEVRKHDGKDPIIAT
jgi:hypothetical protein